MSRHDHSESDIADSRRRSHDREHQPSWPADGATVPHKGGSEHLFRSDNTNNHATDSSFAKRWEPVQLLMEGRGLQTGQQVANDTAAAYLPAGKVGLDHQGQPKWLSFDPFLRVNSDRGRPGQSGQHTQFKPGTKAEGYLKSFAEMFAKSEKGSDGRAHITMEDGHPRGPASRDPHQSEVSGHQRSIHHSEPGDGTRRRHGDDGRHSRRHGRGRHHYHGRRRGRRAAVDNERTGEGNRHTELPPEPKVGSPKPIGSGRLSFGVTGESIPETLSSDAAKNHLENAKQAAQRIQTLRPGSSGDCGFGERIALNAGGFHLGGGRGMGRDATELGKFIHSTGRADKIPLKDLPRNKQGRYTFEDGDVLVRPHQTPYLRDGVNVGDIGTMDKKGNMYNDHVTSARTMHRQLQHSNYYDNNNAYVLRFKQPDKVTKPAETDPSVFKGKERWERAQKAKEKPVPTETM